jgi:pilus assembly protein CpaB
MEKKNTGFLVGLLIGVTVGLMAGGFVSGFVGYQRVKKAEKDARSGWNLVPVTVAAQAIPEGTVVTFDMVAQRGVPEQFVTSSIVKPDATKFIINQRLNVPVQAGDLLLWSQFEAAKTATPSPP